VKAVVVYESFWGNTAAVAQAIAEGIGPEAEAMSTSEATPEALAGVELLVVGAPVLGFRLPTEQMRDSLRKDMGGGPAPDLAHPSLRSWLEALPHGDGLAAAFETRIKLSPGGATGTISKELERAGYRSAAKARKFIVTGRYGPLREGELALAKEWGAELAQALPTRR